VVLLFSNVICGGTVALLFGNGLIFFHVMCSFERPKRYLIYNASWLDMFFFKKTFYSNIR